MRTSLRLALVVASIIAVASSTSAVTSFNATGSAAPSPANTAPATISFAQPAPVGPRIVNAEPARAIQALPPMDCPQFPGDYCVDTSQAWRAEQEPTLANPTGSCVIAGEHTPHGSISVVPGNVAAVASPRIIRFRIEIEDGLAIDPKCFSETVTATLTDSRGWTGTGTLGFARVDDESYDFRLVLASPGTTDSLCYPAATGSKYSCRNKDKVVINLTRWESGTDDFSGNMDTYREYLVNHEVGHFLGEGHRSCPGPGLPAPVMMQQTKGVGECTPNGWPTIDER